MSEEMNGASQAVPQAPEPPQFSDDQIVACLKDHIETYERAQKIQPHDKLQENIDCLKAILATFEHPRPKSSGVHWKSDDKGNFELHIFISKFDLSMLRLPERDAKFFTVLMQRNKSVTVLSAMSILFGHWQKEKMEEKRDIARIMSEIAGHG